MLNHVRLVCIAILLIPILQSCALVTLPLDAVDAAYQVTKGVVKGTVAVVDAVTPDLNSKDQKADNAHDSKK